MFRKSAFILTGIICFFNIILWPVNKYEWMLEEDPGMVLPVDGNAGMYALFAIAPLFLWLLFFLGTKYRYENIIVVMVFTMLLTAWLYKYGETVFSVL